MIEIIWLARLKIFAIQPCTKKFADFTQQWVIFLHSRRLFQCHPHTRTPFMVAPPSGTLRATVVQGREDQRISHWGLNLSPRRHTLLPLSLHWRKQVTWPHLSPGGQRSAFPCAQEESKHWWGLQLLMIYKGQDQAGFQEWQRRVLSSRTIFFTDLKTQDLCSGPHSMGEALKSEKVSVISSCSHFVDNLLISVYMVLSNYH